MVFVERGGTNLFDRTVTHTYTHMWSVHKHQEARQRKGVGLCRRGPLSFLCVLVSRRLALKGAPAGPEQRSWKQKKKPKKQIGEEVKGRKRKGGTMEEDEEEVLCYLDKVLEEEEEVLEYGDGELDPITPVYSQFKVRQDGWVQGTHQHTLYCLTRHGLFKQKVFFRFWS